MSTKNSKETIGNQTRDLPACGVVKEKIRKEKTNIELKKRVGERK